MIKTTPKKMTKKEQAQPERENTIAERREALVALGADDAGGPSGLVYTSTAAKLLGIPARQVLTLLKPVLTVPNPNFRSSGGTANLHDPIDILKIRDSAEVSAIRARCGRAPKDCSPTFALR